MKSSWWSYAVALRAQNVTCSQPARDTRERRLVDIKACPLVCVACDIPSMVQRRFDYCLLHHIYM